MEFLRFGRSVLSGLIQAIKTDVDVFLLAASTIFWPFKILRGIFFSILAYVTFRRADGLMTAYISLKKNSQ